MLAARADCLQLSGAQLAEEAGRNPCNFADCHTCFGLAYFKRELSICESCMERRCVVLKTSSSKSPHTDCPRLPTKGKGMRMNSGMYQVGKDVAMLLRAPSDRADAKAPSETNRGRQSVQGVARVAGVRVALQTSANASRNTFEVSWSQADSPRPLRPFFGDFFNFKSAP